MSAQLNPVQSPEYQIKMEASHEFQDMVMVELWKRGIILQQFSSYKCQTFSGETLGGFEIKNDKKSEESNNLWIEYSEKNKGNDWVKSGIDRDDNTWMYIIGNRKTLYLIPKNTLLWLKKSNKYIHKETTTSKAFILPISDVVEKYAALIINVGA